jgi:uncharacterized 2Fe-2S/4Fe-4S cluster protein (DUF4445 family)
MEIEKDTLMKKHRVLFAPSFKEVRGEEGKSVLDTAREAGVYIPSDCNGQGQCGQCRVRLTEGEPGPLSREESDFINEAEQEKGYRLACRAQIFGDISVWVPGEHILDSGPAKKEFSKRLKRINPAVKSYSIDLSEENNILGHFFEKIVRCLELHYGLKDLTVDQTFLPALSGIIREGQQRFSALVWMDQEVIALLSGRFKTCFGLAIDIGTTTVAVYLCDLVTGEVKAEGAITNPQILFGTDIMSRIAYSVNHPGDGVKTMQQTLIASLNGLIDRMSAQNGIHVGQIVDCTVVGNTVMHHIFLGLSPDSLGLWPFNPKVKGFVNIKAGALGLQINPSAYVHVLPVEAGFVGADNVGVLLSEEPYLQDAMSLIIDLGTNGEIVLGNRERLLSCSCATGPAFEGAQITCGMRALTGAIEKVRIDPADLEIDYRVAGRDGWASEYQAGALQPAGICGSGIIDTLAQLFIAGVIKRNGTFSEEADTSRLRIGPSGVMEFVLVWKQETALGRDIVFTQKDIRQIQLAKAALQGGCKILMRHLGLESVTRMKVAGAFGLNIDKENALAIGLFPWCDPKNITLVGNAAGHGAYLALLNREKRGEAEEIANRVTHIELALDEGFQREFLKALDIPYQSMGGSP